MSRIEKMTADRNKVFNKLLSFYINLYPHVNGKGNQHYVVAAWKVIKEIKDEKEFFNAINAKRKEWKNHRQKVSSQRLFLLQMPSLNLQMVFLPSQSLLNPLAAFHSPRPTHMKKIRTRTHLLPVQPPRPHPRCCRPPLPFPSRPPLLHRRLRVLHRRLRVLQRRLRVSTTEGCYIDDFGYYNDD